MTRVIRTERAAFTGLPARAAEPVLSVNASAARCGKGALVAADSRRPCLRGRMSAETIPPNPGPGMVFRSGSPPRASISREPGAGVPARASCTTRMCPPDTDYAVGMESGALWHSVPIASASTVVSGRTPATRTDSRTARLSSAPNGIGPSATCADGCDRGSAAVETTNRAAASSAQCGTVWIQIADVGAPDLSDRRATAKTSAAPI